ncbi:helix-turn-helix transcriptional regulator [Subtercola endophyticus]|uniref:helix-turn-helix transcriptional regulator n=1 Tax=Subtercola endophyticus TaxID=2895559 RepID=UPI001E58E035|nr:WYL domain-containing protein [Subtercola endophyticus]UFS60510.1 WYL domain-containing protein [Subtercola endophyticus]
MAETTSRTLELLNLLQTHRHWPGSELAERLGITARTLRRDIERLRELGYRVTAERGSLGGYRLEAGSQLPPLLLTNDEAVTMAIGLRLAAAQGLVDGALTTQTALAKFEQVLPPAVRERVNALAATITPETPRGEPVAGELLGQLALACRDHERIRFDYVAVDKTESSRSVEPHALVAARRRWFLVCFDLGRDEWRTFRVDRLSHFFGTRVHFEPRELPEVDAATYVERSFGAAGRRFTAEVVLQVPLARFSELLGVWARGATEDPGHPQVTRWPIAADTLETLVSTLLWIPAGIAYEVQADAETLDFLAASATRLASARPA